METRYFYQELAKRITTPEECNALQYIGAIYSTIFFVCLITNLMTLKRIYANKNLTKPISYLFYYLYALNFLGGVLEMPVVIVYSFNCR